MYIIFNQDGSIKKQILNDFIQQGDNNVKTIFVTILGVDRDLYEIGAIASLPNEDLVTLPSENASLTIDGVPYLGKNVTITGDATILAGTIHVNLVITSNNATLVTYNFYLTINKTGLGANDIVNMTVSEYERLLAALNQTHENYVPYIGAINNVNIGNHYYVTSDGNNLAAVIKPSGVEVSSSIASGMTKYEHLKVELATTSGLAIYTLLFPEENGTLATKGWVETTRYTKAEVKTLVDSSGHKIELSIDDNYDMVVKLLDANNNIISQDDIDLPLESIVVSAEYYDTYTYGGTTYEKVIVITLATTDVPTIIPVGDLVDGLVDEDTLNSTLQPYIKSKVINSVLTTDDLLTEFGVEKAFVLDVMGDVLLCYINETENQGYYTMSVVGKRTAYTTQQFTNAELVTNILGIGTLEIDYLPIITLTNAMQTLDSDQLQVANQDNSVIKYNNRLYHKCNDSGTNFEFVCIDYDIVDEGSNQKLTKYEIIVNKSIGATNMITSYTEFYSKGETDALLNAKQNTLESGTNIKTINNQSILGSGNLNVVAEIDINETINEMANTEQINIKKNISEADGTKVINYISNHMWMKDGSLYTSNADYGSTITIPIQKATKIKVYPLYTYGNDGNIGNGAFVNADGNFISNIDANAVWDSEYKTFEVNVPSGVYGIQLNAVYLNASSKYDTRESSTVNASSKVYVELIDAKAEFSWLEIAKNSVGPEQINTESIERIYLISENDGTPIIQFIRNHMWMKDGSLYTSDSSFGSTVTIPIVSGQASIKIKPYFKYNQEGAIDQGAFVNADGTYFDGIMENASWDNDHVYLEVNVPTGAYGIQLNATFTNDDKYTTNEYTNHIKASTISYTSLYKVTVPWLNVDIDINSLFSQMPNNVVDYNNLVVAIQNRLMPLYDDTYKYWDSLKKPFEFTNKKLVAFGDSITYGIANEGSGNYNAEANSYIRLFASKFNMTFVNQAVSASCITYGHNQYTAVCTAIDNYTFDNNQNEFIFIAGGTNDFNSDAPLGQLGDTENTTFYGALDHICQTLQTNAPNSTVVFITPINVNTNNFPLKSDATLTLNKYRNAIWEVATKYGLNVVDGSTLGFASKINTPWGNLMIAPTDGTHPTLAGHRLYFIGLCSKLN